MRNMYIHLPSFCKKTDYVIPGIELYVTIGAEFAGVLRQIEALKKVD